MLRRFFRIVLPLIALPFITAGCGSESAAPPSEGDAPAQSAKSARDELVGTWVIDIEAVKNMPALAGKTDQEVETALTVMASAKLELTFTGTTFQRGQEGGDPANEKEAPYTVVSEEGPELMLEVASGEADGSGQLGIHIEGDTMVFKDGELSFPFKRK